MNRNLIFALTLALAVLLTGCNGTVPAVTVEPTAVIPTEVPPTVVPSPTPTEEPTATPTDVPTPTATLEPTIWEIAETMLAECSGAHPLVLQDSEELAVDPAYKAQLEAAVLRSHPEFVGRFWLYTDFVVQTDETTPSYDGVIRSPFDFVDFPEFAGFFLEETACEGYVLAREDINENFDRDGIIVGEAYLFYEVGGTEPYVLDGELREVHFFFPPVP